MSWLLLLITLKIYRQTAPRGDCTMQINDGKIADWTLWSDEYWIKATFYHRFANYYYKTWLHSIKLQPNELNRKSLHCWWQNKYITEKKTRELDEELIVVATKNGEFHGIHEANHLFFRCRLICVQRHIPYAKNPTGKSDRKQIQLSKTVCRFQTSQELNRWE